jgi:proton-dependent oligopeptide transporter, POT family
MPPASETSAAPSSASPFPRTFWTANVTELFERAAYYAMASFVVIYLGRLGLGKYWPSTLNGLLWTLVYFLPILSGTIADVVGFRRSLLVAFVLLAIGYFFMGYPVWLGGAALLPKAGMTVTATAREVAPVLVGLLLIGMGGSIIKPCISGTVQKTAAARATIGFAIFYMVINIGSLTGRGTAFLVRTRTSISAIFAVAAVCCVVAFFIVLFFYADPDRAAAPAGAPAKPKRSVGRILLDMFLVLGNLRFALFLLVSSGFFFLYAQVYNVLPLYLEKVVQKEPPVDIYTMANPIVIVCFQLLITKLFGTMKPILSMVVGAVVIALAFLLNVVPLFVAGGVRASVWEVLPVGALFVVLTVALVAFGELFTSARTYEYIGALAPKGQEGLFLGYANLPMAIGAITGGPVGAVIFNEVMCKGAVPVEGGLLQLNPGRATAGWCILMGIGMVSAASMWIYHVLLERLESREAKGA